ncbi:MAG: hypothetical protein ABIZ04_06285 [Opitutus sp.]
MKAPAAKSKSRPSVADTRTTGILAALRDARKAAIKSARLHRAPVVYLLGGTIVKARV